MYWHLPVEALERRDVLTGLIAFDADVTHGLTLAGTDRDDVATLSIDNKGTADVKDDQLTVTLASGQEAPLKRTINLWQTGAYGTLTPNIKGITFLGGSGNDVFLNLT